MRTAFDFSPMFRTSIGFDRVFEALENADRSGDNWPPYDIEKKAEDRYRITVAVAGFARNELNITAQANLLIVQGAKSHEGDKQYLYRGLSQRDFELRFELADHVKVSDASLQHGLLTVDLVREVPEAMKPRRIEIASGPTPRKAEKQIEQKKQAA